MALWFYKLFLQEGDSLIRFCHSTHQTRPHAMHSTTSIFIVSCFLGKYRHFWKNNSNVLGSITLISAQYDKNPCKNDGFMLPNGKVFLKNTIFYSIVLGTCECRAYTSGPSCEIMGYSF